MGGSRWFRTSSPISLFSLHVKTQCWPFPQQVSSPCDLSCLGPRPQAPVVISSGPALSSDSDKEGEDEGTEEEELPALPILAKMTKKELGL